MTEIFDQNMNMMLTSNYYFTQKFEEAVCIAVIDESDRSTTELGEDWNLFRFRWPLRKFWLLQTPCSGSTPFSGNDPN